MSTLISWLFRTYAHTEGACWNPAGFSEESYIDISLAPPVLSIDWSTLGDVLYDYQLMVAYWDHSPSPTEIADATYHFWRDLSFSVDEDNSYWQGPTNFNKSGYYAFVLLGGDGDSGPSSAIGISGTDYGPSDYPPPFPPTFTGPGPQGGAC